MSQQEENTKPTTGRELSDEELKRIVLEKANINVKKETNSLLNIPTEIISLPTKGYYYPEESPLYNGQVEMRMMTAKEEDILASKNLLRKGLAIDRMLESMIITPIKLGDLLQPDYDALVIASRILGYGKDYKIQFTDPDDPEGSIMNDIVDLTELDTYEPEDMERGENIFDFQLPYSKVDVRFKILTQQDISELSENDKKNSQVVKTHNKYAKEASSNLLTSRLAKMIVEVNGQKDTNTIRKFVDNIIARDSKALRDEYKRVVPTIKTDIKITSEYSGNVHEISLPMGTEFFWPEV